VAGRRWHRATLRFSCAASFPRIGLVLLDCLNPAKTKTKPPLDTLELMCRSIREAPPKDLGAPNRDCTAGAQLGSTNASMLPHGPLIPELEQLRWLEHLEFELYTCVVQEGIPTAWVAPGAFPRLQR
jgi:hypothetical protein